MALPKTDDMVVLRTDFSDQAAWEAVCAAIRPPGDPEGRTAQVQFVDDPAFRDLTPEQILALATEEDAEDRLCLFVVDGTTLGSPEWPVLVLDLLDEPGSGFRVVADMVWMIETNLSLGNADLCDFAEGVDEDGVFRGSEAPSPEVVFAAMRDALRATRGN